MSKKALLEEGSVRQFMRLANLKPLAEEFVTDLYKEELEEVNKVVDEEVTDEVTEGSAKEEVNEVTDEEVSEEIAKEEITKEEMEDDPMEDDPMADEPPADEPPADDAMDAMADDADLGDKEGLLKDVVNAVAAVLGVEVSMDSAEAEAPADDEMPADLDADADAEMEIADAPVEGEVYQESNLDLDSVVAEVTKRVRERLAAENK